MLYYNALSLRNLEGREEFAMIEINNIEGKPNKINVNKIHINLVGGIKDQVKIP